MGLSKADVEEVEELARSVARQMRAQMELRGRFQGVDQENIAKGTTDPRVEFISQVPHKS